MQNLFQDFEIPSKGTERFDTLLQRDGLRIERIVSASVQDGAWYDQAGDEWVVLLEGEAVLEFDDGARRLAAGDWLFIPAHRRHRVRSTSERAVWLAVHTASSF